MQHVRFALVLINLSVIVPWTVGEATDDGKSVVVPAYTLV